MYVFLGEQKKEDWLEINVYDITVYDRYKFKQPLYLEQE